MLRGREIAEGDRQGTLPVAVVSELFARTNFGDANPIGRHIEVGGSMQVGGAPLVLEIVGVAANAQIRRAQARDSAGRLRAVRAASRRRSCGEMTYALRTDGDPLRYVGAVRQIVHEADGRVPVTNIKTQAADIDQTINQEIVFARLCSAFAILALVIACVGLYATMAYAVARRTSEIGLRMALGAGRGAVIWMVLREVCVLAAVGLAIGVPTALAHVAADRVVPVRDEAERSARAGAGGGHSAGRGARGRLRTGAAGVARRSDDRPAPRVSHSRQTGHQRARFGRANGAHLAALAAAAEEPIAAIGLEPGHVHSRRHLEALEHLAGSRIDAPHIALVAFQVPCHSSPSTHVTPVTKRFDSIVRRIAPVSGSI